MLDAFNLPDITGSMDKIRYRRMRKLIRSVAFINCSQAARNRQFLEDYGSLLVGGMVLEKQYLEWRYSRQKGYMELELLDPENKTSDYFEAYGGNIHTSVVLFDGSGSFPVHGNCQTASEDIKRKFYLAKTGDILFVWGKVIPCVTGRSKEGFSILPEHVFSPDEWEFYKTVYSDKVSDIKQAIGQIKQLDVPEAPSFTMEHCQNSMDVLRRFLKRDPRISNTDFSLLALAIYEIYEKHPLPWIAQLVWCVFKKAYLDLYDRYEIKRKFEYIYPNLNNVVQFEDG